MHNWARNLEHVPPEFAIVVSSILYVHNFDMTTRYSTRDTCCTNNPSLKHIVTLIILCMCLCLLFYDCHSKSYLVRQPVTGNVWYKSL